VLEGAGFIFSGLGHVLTTIGPTLRDEHAAESPEHG